MSIPDDTNEIGAVANPPAKHSSWYLVTGLILGLILGLVYSWLVNPVIYHNTAPASLDEPSKDVYRSLISQVYVQTGNFDRAVHRLDLLEDEQVVLALGAQAQRALAADNQEEAHALALLASHLQSTQINSQNSDGLQPLQPTPSATIIRVPTQTLPAVTPAP